MQREQEQFPTFCWLPHWVVLWEAGRDLKLTHRIFWHFAKGRPNKRSHGPQGKLQPCSLNQRSKGSLPPGRKRHIHWLPAPPYPSQPYLASRHVNCSLTLLSPAIAIKSVHVSASNPKWPIATCQLCLAISQLDAGATGRRGRDRGYGLPICPPAMQPTGFWEA